VISASDGLVVPVIGCPQSKLLGELSYNRLPELPDASWEEVAVLGEEELAGVKT
jgi:hypothetical protein